MIVTSDTVVDNICRVCNHLHVFIIDSWDDGRRFIAEYKWCNDCPCKKAILTNLEYLEYKYEESQRVSL
jgi:hypothetical protein